MRLLARRPRCYLRPLPRTLKTIVYLIAGLILAGCGEQQSQLPATPASSNVQSATAPGAAVAPGAQPQFYPPTAVESTAWTGRLVRYQPNLVLLTVRGSPTERGTAHGMLLKPEIQRLIRGLHDELKHNRPEPEAHFAACLAGARKMKSFLEPDVLAELTACAAAAAIPVDELLLVQLYGDINRAEGFTTLCSAYAAFGPATVDGNLQFGRNLDYPVRNLDKTLPMILQEIPTGENAGRPFITIGFAGIISGWTAMNADGLCAENNTLFNGVDSTEGLATCFMVRKVVERATTVEAAVKILETTPRACTTAMIVAGRNQAGHWDGRLFEFDHKTLVQKQPEKGLLWETNTCQKLPTSGRAPTAEPGCSRFQTLKRHLTQYYGQLDFANDQHNLVAKQGVYLSINLHCAWLDPARQEFKLAVAPDPADPAKPAAENKFHHFRITATAIKPR